MAVRLANFFMMSPLNDYWWGHQCKLRAKYYLMLETENYEI
jgi:hypothetical protein